MSHRLLGIKLSPRSSFRRNNSQYWGKKGDNYAFLFDFFTEYLKSTNRTLLKEESKRKKKSTKQKTGVGKVGNWAVKKVNKKQPLKHKEIYVIFKD